jgi:hypothetical protein
MFDFSRSFRGLASVGHRNLTDESPHCSVATQTVPSRQDDLQMLEHRHMKASCTRRAMMGSEAS